MGLDSVKSLPVTILGHSGFGETTILRMNAALKQPMEGCYGN